MNMLVGINSEMLLHFRIRWHSRIVLLLVHKQTDTRMVLL